MTTRAQIRATIRNELNDAGGTPLWSDALLNEWLAEGLRDYGRRAGLAKSQTLVSVAGQAAYTLATDAIQVTRVEHPTGVYRVPAPFAAGDVAPTSAAIGVDSGVGAPLIYDVWAGTLTLSPPPARAGESIVVRYLGAYAEPSGDASVLDVPAREEEAMVFYVCRRALQWIGLDEAKRQRFERQRGANPNALARQYAQEYLGVVRQRHERTTRRLVVRT
jgi:hypothetical protein